MTAMPSVVPTPRTTTCAVDTASGTGARGPGTSQNTPSVARTTTLLSTGAHIGAAKRPRAFSRAASTADSP